MRPCDKGRGQVYGVECANRLPRKRAPRPIHDLIIESEYGPVLRHKPEPASPVGGLGLAEATGFGGPDQDPIALDEGQVGGEGQLGRG